MNRVDGVVDIYARVSQLRRGRGSDERERSPEGQVAACRASLADRGLREGLVLVDPGLSAWRPEVARPAWDQLMGRVERGESAGLIVFDLERFSRQPEDGERLIKLASRGLLVLDSESEYDLTTANGKKSFRDAMTAAAYYSDRLSTRIKRGKRLKAMAGEVSVSQRPFGFEADGVTVRPDEAAVLADLTARLLAGESQDRLIDELNAQGVWTSTGGRWTRAGMRQVLTRPRNAGRLIHQGQVVGRLPGAQIIADDDYEAVCALYESRRPGGQISAAYLCSGIAHCGRCGKPLHGRRRANMKPYPDGSVRRQYWCHPDGCGRLSADQRGVDEAVAALVVAILSDPRNAAAVEQEVASAASEAAKLDAQIAEAEEMAGTLAERLGRGEMSLARHDRAVAALDARIGKLRQQRAALRTRSRPLPEAASRAQWKRRWDAATTEQRRALIWGALRDRKLIIRPADTAAPRRFDPTRVTLSRNSPPDLIS